jgi:hypothetical protein
MTSSLARAAPVTYYWICQDISKGWGQPCEVTLLA